MLEMTVLKYGEVESSFFFQNYTIMREREKNKVQVYKSKNTFKREISTKAKSETKA